MFLPHCSTLTYQINVLYQSKVNKLKFCETPLYHVYSTFCTISVHSDQISNYIFAQEGPKINPLFKKQTEIKTLRNQVLSTQILNICYVQLSVCQLKSRWQKLMGGLEFAKGPLRVFWIEMLDRQSIITLIKDERCLITLIHEKTAKFSSFSQ